MVRKLAMAVSLAVGSTLPLSVYALGLGEIRTSSALNESFKGEIELLSVEKGQLDTLKVGLAPAEVFARTGVERPFHLSQLKFKALRRRDGRAVILVTSEAPIREPFLDFFVQVSWPNGKLVREYTVLLDPPATTQRRAPQVKKAESTVAAPVVEEETEMRYAAAVPGGEYGPVRPNETLWKIASRTRPTGITVHQMMVALYRANPEAFLNRNINLLKKGRILRIPQINEIEGIDRREAVAEFQRLSEGWVPAAAVTETETAGEGTASVPASPPEAAEAPADEGRLRIAGAEETGTSRSGAAESKVTGGDDVEALTQKLLLVEEEAATARQESENLRERMRALEQQLQDMKRLLELRDQELAQLQAQAAGAAVTEPETEPAVPEMDQGTAAAPVEDMRGSDVSPEPDVGMTTAPSEEAAPVQQPEVVPPAPKPAAVSAPAPRPAEPLWKQWILDNWQMAAAGGGAVLLLLLGLVATRRRKRPEEQQVPPSATVSQAPAGEEQESILEEESAAAVAAADTAMGDTSFLSEYSTEELRALHEDTTEVDPVSEADVYLAYGRYSQAEEILREAMKNGDDSAAIRHKMLEVYYATQKKEEFEKLAEEMVAAGQDKEDPKAWEHIQTMGRDLDRANPLFAAAAAAGAVSAEGEGDDQDSDLSLDLSTLAEEVDSQLNSDSEPLDSFSNMDLELPSLQIEPEVRDESAEEAAEADDLKLNETELHTELADLSELGDLEADATTLDETLADLTGDLEGVMADSLILDQPMDLEAEGAAGLEDLSVEETETTSGMEEAAEGPEEKPEDTRIGDEVETKLELAKAFMEIGDADGARSILQEVQEDGTPQQKEAAAELLSQLDG